MKISEETIRNVASLARLKLSDSDIIKLKVDMENIISYVNKLDELDVSDVEPTAHIMSVNNVLRDDKVKESYKRDQILENAPSEDEGCFKVPKIVE
ncbi:MAG: Asp-tRNA(Asn)/Glu-tRNA(Gln) amidotransferase subunit GatC [Clostridiales bacterium]